MDVNTFLKFLLKRNSKIIIVSLKIKLFETWNKKKNQSLHNLTIKGHCNIDFLKFKINLD